NTLNTQFDRIVFPSLNRLNKDWNPKWSSAISVKPGVWTTEIAIPFSQLKLASPSEGTVWRGNLCREEKGLGENSSYFLTGGHFTDPSFFGAIVFGDLSLSLTKEITVFEEGIKNIKERIEKENFVDLLTKIDAISNNLQRIKEQVPSELTEKTHYQKLKREVAMLRISFENLAFKFYALKDEYLVWQKNPLNSLSLLRNKIPMNLKKTKEINLIMGMNEEEMVSLVITNLRDNPLCGRIMVSRFKDGKGQFISPDFIELRAPVFVELRGHKLVDDLLPSLNEINEITIPARENKEILFIVDSHNLSAGNYKGIIDIRPFERKTVKTVKFNISVLPVDLKEDHLRFWPFGIFSGIPEELLGDYIKDMAHHRGNAFTMSSGRVPNPVLDAQKRVKEPFEAHKLPFFNKLLSLCKEYWAEETIVAVPTFRAYPYLERKGLEYLSPEWKNALKTYFTALIAHLKEFGFSEENIALFPYDEISGKEGSERFCEVAKIIKEVNPKVKIFLTQGGHTALEDIKITSPYVDIWCPNVMHLSKKDKMAVMKATGKPIWSYDNRIARLTGSPLTVRKYAWMSWKENLQGIGSWAYDYWAGDPWSEFDAKSKRSNRAYIYPGKRGPIPSRRWEAFRETMEDHETLFCLKNAIKEAKNKKIDISLSQRLLNEAVNTVLKSDNPDVISQYKVEILKEIVRLQNL
ncbi:DUF4091 domain-containing protein, partial [candidate division WOR-3 bacterium]|nr:DUF4091 domain-containing protein [candidate division WOR-3 bacterium]